MSHAGKPSIDGGAGGEAGSPSVGAGAGGQAGHATIPDESDRVDPLAEEPTWGAWQALGLSSSRIPSVAPLGPSAFRLVARNPDDQFFFADFERNPGIAVAPAWTSFLGDYAFAGDAAIVVRSIDFIAVALGTDSKVYRAHWNYTQKKWYGWWPAGPELADAVVGIALDGSRVLYAGRGSDDRLRLAAFNVDTDWPNEWPLLGVSTSFQPALALGTDGVHVLLTDKSGTLLHALRPLAAGPDWNEWSWEPLTGVVLRSSPMLITRTPSVLDVFARATDDCVYWQSRRGDQWSGWIKVSGPVAANALAVADGPDSFFLFTENQRGVVSGRRHSEQGWTRWTALGEISGVSRGDFPGSAFSFGENDVRLFAAAPLPWQQVRMLTVTPP